MAVPGELESAIPGRASWTRDRAIEQLRGFDPLVRQPDTPAEQSTLLDDPKAIFAAMPPETHGYQLAVPVSVLFAGSDTEREGVDVSYLVRVHAVATEDWHNTYTSSGLMDVLDCAASAFAQPWPPDLRCLGGSGGSDNIRATDQNRLFAWGEWRFERHLSPSHP